MFGARKQIAIVTSVFFSLDGASLIIGGAERYTRDLCHLTYKIGYQPVILQCGTHYWENNYEGIPVKAFPFSGSFEKSIEEGMRNELSKYEFAIYMWIGFQKKYITKSIGICHGIWFDAPGNDENFGINCIRTYGLNALYSCRRVVSVDLNFINFCRNVIPQGPNDRLTYIPNYVDTDNFKPASREKDGFIEILYPRRYDKYRGIYLMQNIVPEILELYPNVRFNFALDKNVPAYVVEWDKWYSIQKHKDRIKYAHYSMNEMPLAYKDADIVIIPSICSEGTSLSILEAMAMKKAVVASNIGGICNIVLPNVNGKIVNPTEKELKKALIEYINNDEEREIHGNLAHQIVELGFSKKRWDEQWSNIIREIFI